MAPVQATCPQPRRWRCDECNARHPVASVHRPHGWVTLLVHEGQQLKAKVARLFCSKACAVNWITDELRGVRDYPVVPVHEDVAS